ncbi:hypothetical protein GE09DRAFT_1294194 [Coniochaeta sp. 2T2.1]|nr:hypothetical protein GE09DRAFT_1294194 [Coniochaeta sp. 2T2.1]
MTLGEIVAQPPRLGRGLVDISSFLIQHWVNSVCSSWSTFDNEANPYRRLAASLWQSDNAVFYAFTEDRDLLDFFNGCLIYEKMLHATVSDDETDTKYLAKWQVMPDLQISVVLQPWTGVSVSLDLLRLVGKAMFICSRSRIRWQQAASVQHAFTEEAWDFREAAAVEDVLLSVELPESSAGDDTSEQSVLKRHLNAAAEAYRSSALLQLYQTFPGLIARRLPAQADSGHNQSGYAQSEFHRPGRYFQSHAFQQLDNSQQAGYHPAGVRPPHPRRVGPGVVAGQQLRALQALQNDPSATQSYAQPTQRIPAMAHQHRHPSLGPPQSAPLVAPQQRSLNTAPRQRLSNGMSPHSQSNTVVPQQLPFDSAPDTWPNGEPPHNQPYFMASQQSSGSGPHQRSNHTVTDIQANFMVPNPQPFGLRPHPRSQLNVTVPHRLHLGSAPHQRLNGMVPSHQSNLMVPQRQARATHNPQPSRSQAPSQPLARSQQLAPSQQLASSRQPASVQPASAGPASAQPASSHGPAASRCPAGSRSRAGTNNNPCDICGKGYFNHGNMMFHKLNVHFPHLLPTLLCPFPGCMFRRQPWGTTRKSTWDRHLEVTHGLDRAQIQQLARNLPRADPQQITLAFAQHPVPVVQQPAVSQQPPAAQQQTQAQQSHGQQPGQASASSLQGNRNDVPRQEGRDDGEKDNVTPNLQPG